MDTQLNENKTLPPKILWGMLLLLWFLQEGHSLAEPSDGVCMNNDIFVDENVACSPYYYRCESNDWLKAFCVSGIFNSTMRECLPFSVQCPDTGMNGRDLPIIRQKRQVEQPSATGDDCSATYLCPATVVQEIVYPDWASKECDTFYQCLRGELTRRSCHVGEYRYYNPRTLSCERSASRTNTCLQREATDLGPIIAL